MAEDASTAAKGKLKLPVPPPTKVTKGESDRPSSIRSAKRSAPPAAEGIDEKSSQRSTKSAAGSKEASKAKGKSDKAPTKLKLGGISSSDGASQASEPGPGSQRSNVSDRAKTKHR